MYNACVLSSTAWAVPRCSSGQCAAPWAVISTGTASHRTVRLPSCRWELRDLSCGGCVQGATVFDMRYLATIVANCFLAFGEILQMNTRVQELSAGVARVAQLLHTTEAAEDLQQNLTATNISGCCSSGAQPPTSALFHPTPQPAEPPHPSGSARSAAFNTDTRTCVASDSRGRHRNAASCL